MSSVNKAIIVGRLTKDPEVRRTQSGDAVVTFSLATSDVWRDRNSGERKERSEFHNVVVFNENIGKVAEQYLKKGSRAYVEGAIQTRKWTDKDGNDRYTTEIVLQKFGGNLVLLDSRKDSDSGSHEFGSGHYESKVHEAARQERQPQGGKPVSPASSYDLNDEVPFLMEARG